MSYTMDNEELDEPMAALRQALMEVQEVLRNRINHKNNYGKSEWSDTHLRQCREWVKKLTEWEMLLREDWD